MSRIPVLFVLLLLFLAAPWNPGPLEAQSLLGAGGLGVPVDPMDARARAMGSGGPGLFGWHLSPHDPGAGAGMNLPSVTATLQPTSSQMVRNGETLDVGGTYFPHVAVSYPFDRGVLSVTLAGVLDQEWDARVESTMNLAGEPVVVEDIFRSRGGVSSLRVGWSRRIGTTLGVGAALGTYLGSIDREFSRTFDQEAVGEDVEPFRARGRWNARGLNGLAGVTWQPSSSLRLGGSMTWPGSLEMRSVDGGEAEDERGTYDLPVELRLAASGRLTSQLAVSLGVGTADWTSTGEDLQEGGTVGRAWNYGGGLEWSAIQLLGRTLPLRFGYRAADLPFLFEGQAASERSTVGGIGIHLSDAEAMPLARIDVAVERGDRDAGTFSEEFWRTTVTLRLAGG